MGTVRGPVSPPQRKNPGPDGPGSRYSGAELHQLDDRHLGGIAAILIDLLNPEKIVIGSIFVRSEHLIRSAMQEVIDRECIPAAAAACSVVPAALGESLGDIAALSVASL